MKKILLISLMFLSFCFLSCNKNIMENYVSKDYYNYDFIINNPLFYNESFPDLDEVKGKIVKRVNNSYEMLENGKTRYGDCYTWVDYNYFFFDKNGRITKKIYFNIVDDVFMGSKKERNYSLDDNKLKVQIIEYPEAWDSEQQKKIKETEYSFTEDGSGSLIIEKLNISNDENQQKIIFQDGKITLIDNNLYEWEYKNENTIYNCYKNSGSKEELFGTNEYDKGIIQKEITYSNYKYVKEFSGNQCISSFYEGSNLKGKGISFLKREYYPSGMLKYQEIKPEEDSDTEVGWYEYLTVDILSEPDEKLLEFYNSIKDAGN